MSAILLLFLTVCKFSCLRCEISDTPGMLTNTINDKDPFTNEDVSSMIYDDGYLPVPISSINIDYANNALILHFRRNGDKGNADDKTRSLLDKNFMRFGRSNSENLMRFGKRQAESIDSGPEYRVGRNENGARDSRGDNFMRFGRPEGNYMRFGRAQRNTELLDNAAANRIKLSRPPLQNPMRFGRSSDRDLMRFGRGTDNRFGDKSFMRFGRNMQNMMRLGRSDSFMRLGRVPNEYDDYLNEKLLKISGRADPHLMRFGRSDKNFMRFGKLDQNFMRFGKRDKGTENKTADHDESIPSSKEDSLDTLWKTTDEFSPSDSESVTAQVDRSENMIPAFVMGQ